MNGKTRRRDFMMDGNIFCAASGEHFRGLDGDVFGHGKFVFAPGAIDFQRRNAPGVDFFLVDLDVIVVIRQTFAKSANSHAPRSRHFQRILEINADADFVDAAGPAFAAPAALVTVAAHKIFLLRFYIPKTKQKDFVRGYGYQGGGSREGWSRGINKV